MKNLKVGDRVRVKLCSPSGMRGREGAVVSATVGPYGVMVRLDAPAHPGQDHSWYFKRNELVVLSSAPAWIQRDAEATRLYQRGYNGGRRLRHSPWHERPGVNAPFARGFFDGWVEELQRKLASGVYNAPPIRRQVEAELTRRGVEIQK